MEWLIPGLLLLSLVCFIGFLVRRHRPGKPVLAAILAPPAALPPLPADAGHLSPLPYLRRPQLLTRAEQDFFNVLQGAVPIGWHILPQVRLANLVEVALHARRSYTYFNCVAAKCVDFVLCEATTMTPRLVIELDDASHQRPDRQRRDAFVDAVLHAAQLPIVHVRWQSYYELAQLAVQIQAACGMQALAIESLPSAAANVQRSACRSCRAMQTLMPLNQSHSARQNPPGGGVRGQGAIKNPARALRSALPRKLYTTLCWHWEATHYLSTLLPRPSSSQVVLST